MDNLRNAIELYQDEADKEEQEKEISRAEILPDDYGYEK